VFLPTIFADCIDYVDGYLFLFQGSVLALDDSIVDGDQVDYLIKFCPTKEEMELLKVHFFFLIYSTLKYY
jgi:hypothetical protein